MAPIVYKNTGSGKRPHCAVPIPIKVNPKEAGDLRPDTLLLFELAKHEVWYWAIAGRRHYREKTVAVGGKPLKFLSVKVRAFLHEIDSGWIARARLLIVGHSKLLSQFFTGSFVKSRQKFLTLLERQIFYLLEHPSLHYGQKELEHACQKHNSQTNLMKSVPAALEAEDDDRSRCGTPNEPSIGGGHGMMRPIWTRGCANAMEKGRSARGPIRDVLTIEYSYYIGCVLPHPCPLPLGAHACGGKLSANALKHR